ncbi:MAG: hypothetical protein EA404_14720 [Spirochaetaceae bacterium]|nr:MAG: hypothetical protein EA404_14720 [Spirochaetaceae bacterium]
MKRYMLRLGVPIVLAVIVGLAVVACGGPAPPRVRLEITSPASRAETGAAEVTVTGIVSDASATVKINDATAAVAGDGSFSHTMPLPYGTTRISVAAEVAGQSPITRTLNVTRKLALNVSSPEDNSVVAQNPVTVAGTVSDAAAKVYVAGSEVRVADDGSFSTDLPLHYAETVIKVTAQLEGTDPLSTLVTVTRAR